MKILKVIKVSNTVELCGVCGGAGWYWSELEFGDAPGDEHKIRCSKCDGSGRVVEATLAVIDKLPITKVEGGVLDDENTESD